jgi:hypothetical protein
MVGKLEALVVKVRLEAAARLCLRRVGRTSEAMMGVLQLFCVVDLCRMKLSNVVVEFRNGYPILGKWKSRLCQQRLDVDWT